MCPLSMFSWGSEKSQTLLNVTRVFYKFSKSQVVSIRKSQVVLSSAAEAYFRKENMASEKLKKWPSECFSEHYFSYRVSREICQESILKTTSISITGCSRKCVISKLTSPRFKMFKIFIKTKKLLVSKIVIYTLYFRRAATYIHNT